MQEVLDNMIKTATDTGKVQQVNVLPIIDDYSELLKNWDIKYKRTDYYLEVGEPIWVQGWIINVSVIQVQFPKLLENVIPLLVREQIPFKIARSSRKASTILSGELGWLMLGKVLCIYPSNEKQAVKLATELIRITEGFRGPEILTDRKLGGVIHTQWGTGNPIIRVNSSGKEERCIYDTQGNLIPEFQTIPFEIPEGIIWPFDSIVPEKRSKKESVLQDRYKPMYMLKKNPKEP